MNEKKEIIWKAPEFEYVEKGALWYLAFGIAFLAMIIFGWATNNFFFTIFLLIAGIMIVALSNRKPELIAFKLDGEGCIIGESPKVYRYEDLESFSIVEKGNKDNLLVFKRKTIANPYLKLPLPKSATDDARVFLDGKLEEKSYEETLLDVLIEKIGL